MALQFPTPADRVLARDNARQIAAALKSKVASNPKRILGSPDSPFKVPFHTNAFWFTVLVSDCTYTIEANHKRGLAAPARFCVSIKRPWPNAATSRHLEGLSRELGFAVYTTESDSEEAVVTHLLSPRVRPILCRLDLSPVHLFFLSAAQILVESEFTDLAQCIDQIHLFRELLLTIARPEISTA